MGTFLPHTAPERIKFGLGFVKERTPRALRHTVRGQLLKPIAVVSNGTAFECPVCGATPRLFIRRRCPSCGAMARTRLIALFLQREVGIANGPARVLHFAPEPGLERFMRRRANIDYTPADLNPAPGHERVDATRIHVAPGFDGIVTSHVLEHIPDDRTAMAEMFRVLKPGGWAVVLTPVSPGATYEDPAITSPWDRHVHFGQHDHVRIYGDDLPERLEAAGFEVDIRRYSTEVSTREAERYGLSREPLYFCRKPLTSVTAAD